MKTKKQLPNYTAVLRSEVKTQADLDAMVEVAKYQGFDMSNQHWFDIGHYHHWEYMYLDRDRLSLKRFIGTYLISNINLITLAEFLSYGEPKTSWYDRKELPPVGTELDTPRVTGSSGVEEWWDKATCSVVGHHVDGKRFFIEYLSSNQIQVFDTEKCDIQYRKIKITPIKSGRELAVEEMLEYLPEYQPDIVLFCEQYSQNLYDKGYHIGKKVNPLPYDWELDWKKSATRWMTRYQYLTHKNYCIAKGE